MMTPARPRPTRARLLTPLLALAALLASAAGLEAQRASFGAVMQDTTLENGLQVIVVPNPTVSLVTIQVTVRNGAFTQLEPDEEGLPHLLEHMLFRGYDRGFEQSAGRLHAYYNGTTSFETVTYYLTLPSQNLDGGVALLADLMRAPRFEANALASEKKVVQGELERSVSNPTYLLDVEVDRKLWGDDFQRKNAIGTIPTISGATPRRLRQMYDRFYVPNNAAVVITGDVTPEAAFASAGRRFDRWRRGADPFDGLELPAMRTTERHEVVIVEADAADITLLVRWPGPSVRANPEDTYAADLFSAVVNDPISPFQERLVDSGLFQSVSMGYQTLDHVGPITLFATTTAGQVVEASLALREELNRFSEPDYVTRELLEIARKRQEVDWAMEMETPSGLAFIVGELWSVADLDYARGYVEALQAQTEKDLERFAARYLTDRPRVTGIMLSNETRRELGNSLGMALAPWRR